MDKWLEEYHERFNEYFPMEETKLPEAQLIEAIKHCLEINEPYPVDYSQDRLF